MDNNNNVSFYYRLRQVDTTLDEIPKIERDTLAIMKKMKFPGFNEIKDTAVKALISLKDKATTLADVQKKLKEPLEKQTKSNLWALFRVALVIAIVVAVVVMFPAIAIGLGGVLGGFAAAGVCVGGFFATGALACYGAHRVGLELDDEVFIASIAFGPILGIAYPIYELFDKNVLVKPRLERKEKKLKKDLEQHQETVVRVFKQDEAFNVALGHLKEKIDNVGRFLVDVKTTSGDKAFEGDIQRYLNNYQKAYANILSVQQFVERIAGLPGRVPVIA